VTRTANDSAPTVLHLEGVAPGWFSLVDVPIILGRDVQLADTSTIDHRVVIGSDLARLLWGNENPIGRSVASPPLSGMQQDSIRMTAAGVYDATHALPTMLWSGGPTGGDKTWRVYTAHGKQWQRNRLLVRTRGAAEPFLPTLHAFLRDIAPAMPMT